MEQFDASYRDVYEFTKDNIDKDLQVLLDYYHRCAKPHHQNIDLMEEAHLR